MSGDFAKLLMALGVVIFALGALLGLLGKVPWLGRLPGDILIEREHFRFYFPLGTCVALSLLLSLVVWLIRR